MSFFGNLWNGVKNVFSGIGNFFGSSRSDNLTSLLGALGSAGMNAGYGAVSSKQQFDYARKLQEQSFGYNKKLQSQSLDLSKKLQAYQNAYTTQMASTAHQIEVADLRKAGLNPILSATGGNGASFSTGGATVGSASVGSGSVSAPDFGDAVAAYQGYLNSKMTKEQIQNLKADSYLKGNQASTEGERFATQVQITRDLENQIKNRDLVSGAQANYYKNLGFSALMDSFSKRLEASANARFQNERARGFTETHGKGFGANAGFDWIKKSGSLGGNYNDYESRTY